MAEPARPLPNGMHPLGLDRMQAAAYCGMTPGEFDAGVKRGTLPAPLPTGTRRRLWHTEALRKALDDMAGIAQPSLEEEALGRVERWRQSL